MTMKEKQELNTLFGLQVEANKGFYSIQALMDYCKNNDFKIVFTKNVKESNNE